MPLTEQDKKFLAVAISEAQQGFNEGGIPIGASLVSKDGTLLAQGHNMRMQKYAQIRFRFVGIDHGRGSATLHGETSCLENAGRLPANVYKGATMVRAQKTLDL